MNLRALGRRAGRAQACARTWRRITGAAAPERRDGGGHLGVSRNRSIRHQFSISDRLTIEHLRERYRRNPLVFLLSPFLFFHHDSLYFFSFFFYKFNYFNSLYIILCRFFSFWLAYGKWKSIELSLFTRHVVPTPRPNSRR